MSISCFERSRVITQIISGRLIMRLGATFFSLMLLLIAGYATASSDKSADKTAKFDGVVRMGYIPHPAFLLDNGVPSGALSDVMECSMKYFPRIEFVEMPNYERLLFALETNVVDIGLNMVRTQARDKVAKHAVDIFKSRIILVTRDDGQNKKSLEPLPVGRLAARLGSEIDRLLTVKGYKVDVNAYTVERMMEMFRAKHINSFAEAEISVFDTLKALDQERFGYDYQVLSEQWGGAYVTFDFNRKNPEVIPVWRKVVESCRYLAPELR
jgi:ABC-type amino acid transport substrate-binding protein